MPTKKTIFTSFLTLISAAFLSFLLLCSCFYLYLSPQLPDINSLKEIQLQTPLRIFSSDMKLIGEYGEKRRSPITYSEIPASFTKAILAAEDDRFYQHGGIDITSLVRAMGQLLKTGRIQSGGSTITMQVARNYFLTHRQTFSRKFNEILLSLQIERQLTKNEILELYVNKIFLGNRAYGIEAAAQVYYGKSINELNLAQLAMIAGLPKAPSTYNPLVNPDRALLRRNWILERMNKLGFITAEEYQKAKEQPITAVYHGPTVDISAPYVAEMARQKAVEKFGANAYTDGYSIVTTIDSALQEAAQAAVLKGVIDYDQRHGFRGAEDLWEIDNTSIEEISKQLQNESVVAGLQPAIVVETAPTSIALLTRDGELITLDWNKQKSHLRPYINENTLGRTPETPDQTLQKGNLVRLSFTEDRGWQITQIPKNQAALIALNPDNGAIIAVVGGFDFYFSKYNRVTQATRQPGSNFKPFIYTTALDHGYTASSLINDAPIVFNDDKLESSWRPENSSGKFYGPTRLREALYQSRNLVSIRLLKALGVDNAIDGIERFGFLREALPNDLSLALGSHAVAPIKIATGYASFANGGYRVEPYLVSEIRNHLNETVYKQTPLTVCTECEESDDNATSALSFAETQRIAPRIIEKRVAYIMDSILKDVIQKGTARKARVLGRHDIAGKTGTTNGPTDAWFSGYTPDLVVTTWLGFDQNLNLGKREYGGSAALPIWIDFMSVALKDKPEHIRPQPEGIVTVRINAKTGKRSSTTDRDNIFEIFREEYAPEALPEDNIHTENTSSEKLPTELF
ncbi:MAG: penicillin-binding protein 1A [Pseudomonadales bacterium]|nr:penicillin-binding protein 1A [Pseudomonadales bacterium]